MTASRTTADTPPAPPSPPPPDAPELRTTHSGAVLLLGDLAYKLKRPVLLPFLDFSGVDERRTACAREVSLNRRLAADVYLGVGTLGLPGPDVEPCVVMRRLPEDRRLTHLLTHADRATVEQALADVARVVAVFHAGATRSPAIDVAGTRDAVAARWRHNLAEASSWAGALDPDVVAEIAALVEEFLSARAPLFTRRVRGGAVVDGHGDLLAEDIFCLDDGARVLDCLDFDDQLRHVDALDDIAFLAMDVERLGSTEAADHLLARWAELTGDQAPPSLVHHYIAYRAFVRAKVGCLSGAAHDTHHGRTSTPEEFAGIALRHLRQARVRLVLCGGAPGTGKSSVAAALADRHGWVVLSSDRVRKELAGLDPESSAAAAFGTGIYDAAWDDKTYAELLHRAETLLGLGESVIIDATWHDASSREQAARSAARCSVPLTELVCVLDERLAAQRIDARVAGPSDADASVAHQLRRHTDSWPTAHRVDTTRPLTDTVGALDAAFAWDVSGILTSRRPRPRMAPD